jgi:hypothetical protein
METCNATHHNTNATLTFGATGTHAVLRGISINTKGATANVCTVAGVKEGTVAVIDTTTAVGYIDFFNARFKDGFTVTMATGTAADLTIFWE